MNKAFLSKGYPAIVIGCPRYFRQLPVLFVSTWYSFGAFTGHVDGIGN